MMTALPGTPSEWKQDKDGRWFHPDHDGLITLREGMSLADYYVKRIKDEQPLTVAELQEKDVAEVETTFTVPTILRAMIKDRFDLENRVRVLEGKPTITLAQFKTALANRIRGNGA